MKRRTFTRQLTFSLITGALAAAQAFAQGTPPAALTQTQAPIKLIVPFTPGTGIDLIARTVGPRLAQRLGRPVVVENKVGASGNIGTESVVRAAPDGQTLLVSVNTLVMNRSLYTGLSFDPVKDLSPVILTSWGQLLLVTHPKSNFKTAAELVAAAKASPGRINYASPGVGTPHHLSMELFKNTAQVFLTHIPYRGAGPALNDTVAGQVPIIFDNLPSALPFIQSGKLVPIAVAGVLGGAAGEGGGGELLVGEHARHVRHDHPGGAGIAEEDQQRLFQRFRQVDMSTTREHGGLGMGH